MYSSLAKQRFATHLALPSAMPISFSNCVAVWCDLLTSCVLEGFQLDIPDDITHTDCNHLNSGYGLRKRHVLALAYAENHRAQVRVETQGSVACALRFAQ